MGLDPPTEFIITHHLHDSQPETNLAADGSQLLNNPIVETPIVETRVNPNSLKSTPNVDIVPQLLDVSTPVRPEVEIYQQN